MFDEYTPPNAYYHDKGFCQMGANNHIETGKSAFKYFPLFIAVKNQKQVTFYDVSSENFSQFFLCPTAAKPPFQHEKSMAILEIFETRLDKQINACMHLHCCVQTTFTTYVEDF